MFTAQDTVCCFNCTVRAFFYVRLRPLRGFVLTVFVVNDEQIRQIC